METLSKETENETNQKTVFTHNTKEAKYENKNVAIDVDSIDLNNYPVIKKVFDGDIIVFKVLNNYLKTISIDI